MMLLVEDNPGDALLLETAFREAGEQVPMLVATTSQRALDLLQSARTSIRMIVVDLRLPGSDGWTVLRAIADDDQLARLPSVVLTSSMRDDDRARARQLGVEKYYVKPVGLEGYDAIVAALLALYRGVRA